MLPFPVLKSLFFVLKFSVSVLTGSFSVMYRITRLSLGTGMGYGIVSNIVTRVVSLTAMPSRLIMQKRTLRYREAMNAATNSTAMIFLICFHILPDIFDYTIYMQFRYLFLSLLAQQILYIFPVVLE